MNTFKQLYQFAQDCLKFESERLNESIQEGEQSIYKVVALFRPSVDGYVFSDTTIKEPTTPANDQLRMIYLFVVYSDYSSPYFL